MECRPFDLSITADIKKLTSWSGSGDMIPLGLEGIARHHLSTGVYVGGELAGYGAVTVLYSGDIIEFGGLVVDPNMRRHHLGSTIAKHVVKQAREELDPELILAFSSERSALLFEKLGGKVIENANTLPPEVWKLCYICPRHEEALCIGKTCCERAFDITGIDT